MKQGENKKAGRLLRRTTSPCPICKGRLDAEVWAVDGRVRMRKQCPEHGDFDLVVSNDAAFYEKAMAIVGPPPKVPERSENFAEMGPLRGVCLDLTSRCNLNCANCFAQANVKIKPDLTLEQITRALDSVPGRAPVVFIQGGEPTLNDQLPDIIRALIARGCVPKLITNGIKLTDADYVKTLKQAGLDWVFFQFDGFDDRTYEAFRGRRLLDIKRRALDNLISEEFSILLAVMIERDYNLGDIGRIIEFAFDTPHVRQISFMPGSRIGRNALTDEESRTEPIDVIDEMDRATGGGVTRDDFLKFLRIARALHRATGNPDFHPKSCFYPMVLHRKNGRIFALNRVLNPAFSLGRPGAVASALRMLANLKRLDHAPRDPDTLWLCIEHFRELATLDINDALHCNKVYLDKQGWFVKSCIYNNLYRT